MESSLVLKELHEKMNTYSCKFLKSIGYLKLDTACKVGINKATIDYIRRNDTDSLQHLLEKVEHALILGKCANSNKTIHRNLQHCSRLWHIVDEIHDIAT